MTRGRRLAAVLLMTVMIACGDSEPEATTGGPEPAGTVVLKDIVFKPAKISVKAGETVTWKFQDRGIAHDVVADDDSFKSELKDSGIFEYTFEKTGSFSYICTRHPGMKGVVEVT